MGKIGKRDIWICGKAIPWDMINSFKGKAKKIALASIKSKQRYYHQLYLLMNFNIEKEPAVDHHLSVAGIVLQSLVKHGYLFDVSERGGDIYRVQA